jgi:hypothetical protein
VPGPWASRPRADAPDALLPLAFLLGRQRTATFFLFALFGAVFFFAQFLQTALAYGPLDAGLRLWPWTATLPGARCRRRSAGALRRGR